MRRSPWSDTAWAGWSHSIASGAGRPRCGVSVFAGTPFAGAVTIFQDLVRGDHAGRNRALLSADALFTFPSAWQLLPPASDFFAGAGLDAFTTSFWIDRGRECSATRRCARTLPIAPSWRG